MKSKARPSVRTSLITALSRDDKNHATNLDNLRAADLSVLRKALDVFESSEEAATWLIEPSTKSVGIRGKAPIVAAATLRGRKLVLAALARIDHGVFS